MGEHDDELMALTKRLEAIEAENGRLLASLHEERRQREEIVTALAVAPGAPLDAVLAAIQDLQLGSEPEGEPADVPLDIVAYPKPEDLPAGYLMRVLRWALAEIEGVTDAADRISGLVS